MNELEQVMFDVICAYARFMYLSNPQLVLTVWEIEELKRLEAWWELRSPEQKIKVVNMVNMRAVEAQLYVNRVVDKHVKKLS